MDKRDKAVKDAVDFLSDFEVLLPCKGSPLYRWVKKEEDMGDVGWSGGGRIGLTEDYMEEKEAYDPNLTLTYVGGCPSRFCYPKGYHRAKERKVETAYIYCDCGLTWDGVPISKRSYLGELPPHVLKLMVAIEERKK